MVVSTESLLVEYHLTYTYSTPGPSDCYEVAVSNVSLGQIISDRA